jgi:hypothetical protein
MAESASNTRRPLPNAFAVLLLGILSLLFSVIYGVPGFLCGVIALLLSRAGKRLRRLSPESYTAGSWRLIVAGRVLATIGLIISLLVMAVLAVMIYVLQVEWEPFKF